MLKIISGLLVLALLWILFAPGSGVVAYLSKRSELKELERQTALIEQKNSELQKDIDKLHNDPEYLERIARKEHGLLKKNERVFDFSRKSAEQDK
ncbi:MAG: FtsB family cell division protein [Desulforhopalus sp.]